MQKIIDFISKHGARSRGRVKIDANDYESDRKAYKASFYFYLFGHYLSEYKRITKQLSLDDPPPNDELLISAYSEIFSPDYGRNQYPEKVYQHLYALAYFYEVLLFEVPSISFQTMLKMDFALLECIDCVVTTTAFSDGVKFQKEALKKAQAHGMNKRKDVSEKRVIELFDNGLRRPSNNSTAEKINERMTKDYNNGNGAGPKPYGKTKIIEILKKAGRL